MLILLSASKKKIGSFVTPSTPQPTVNVFSTDSSAFKYGSYTMTVFPSFKKDGGAFVGGAGTDIVPSVLPFYTSATAFKFSTLVRKSAVVSYKDASAFYYTQNATKSFNLGSESLGLMYPSASAGNSFQFTYEPFKILLSSVNTTGNIFQLYNGTSDRNSVTLYSPYSTSTYNQTLSIQPESF